MLFGLLYLCKHSKSRKLSKYVFQLLPLIHRCANHDSKAEMTEKLIGKVDGFSPESLRAKRLGNEKDLAGTALYLCSKAGAYLNGLALVIDGGALSVRPSSY